MKNTVVTFQEAKDKGEKLSMLTAYDYSTARLIDEAGVISVSREGNWTTLKVESQQAADRLTRKCLRNKITDFRCETVALQDLIREALDGRAG